MATRRQRLLQKDEWRNHTTMECPWQNIRLFFLMLAIASMLQSIQRSVDSTLWEQHWETNNIASQNSLDDAFHLQQDRSNVSTSSTSHDSKDMQQYMSACVLTMDDNHLWPEWLAYHYTVMPLRRLIVGIDSKSQTSSQHIFDRWKGRIHISVWNETRYLARLVDHDWEDDMAKYIYAQRNLLETCSIQIKKEYEEQLQNATSNSTTSSRSLESETLPSNLQQSPWTMWIDPDEYIVRNPLANGAGNTIRSYKENDTVLDIFEKNPYLQNHFEEPCFRMFRASVSILDYPNSLVHSLALNESLADDQHRAERVRATQILLKELQLAPTSSTNASSATRLMTERYRYPHAFRTNSKNLIHVGKATNFRNNNVHIGLRHHCSRKFRFPSEKSPLAVLHYPGTLEQFLARKGDSRSFTEKQYRERYGPDAGKGGRADLFYTDIATGWLPRFVERVGGLDVAKYLLQGAGQVDHSSQL